jgi:hypothetical protein
MDSTRATGHSEDSATAAPRCAIITWGRNPVDNFILARLGAKRVRPPEASS